MFLIEICKQWTYKVILCKLYLVNPDLYLFFSLLKI